MADVSRQEKLASARKKLKKYQKGKKGSSEKITPNTEISIEENDNDTVSGNNYINFDAIKDQANQPFNHSAEIFPSNISSNEPDSKEFLASNSYKPSSEIFLNKDSTDFPHTIPEISETENSIPDSSANLFSITPENSSTSFSNGLIDNSIDRSHLSSSESLRQITLQLNGLMNEGESFVNGDTNTRDANLEELERRNLELASKLQDQERLSDQLKSENKEIKSRNKLLEVQLSKEREQLEEKSVKEQGSLKEQLQVHIQTIGILVAEKTELQSSLTLAQRSTKLKTAEVEDLDGRLKASRQKLSELEGKLNSANSSKDQIESANKTHSKEVNGLKLEISKLSKANEESQNQISELAEKLKIKVQENKDLEKQLAEITKKFSLSDLRVQQLSNNNTNGLQQQIEELTENNFKLEAKIAQYDESFQKLSEERNSLTEQYQQYIQQLNQQVISLRNELQSVSEDFSNLQKENKTLKEQLESQERNPAVKMDQSTAKLEESMAEIKKLNADINTLNSKVEHLQHQLESQVNDNQQLSLIIHEKDSEISSLENSLSRLREEEVDKGKLLDTIQSDKVAASRAIIQNKQLKSQLEELQSGFVQMSNDKLELTEKIMNLEHSSKELQEKLDYKENRISELTGSLEIKDQEILNYSKELLKEDQINDRMQHYEAQSQLASVLQAELVQAQDKIAALTSLNLEMKSKQSSVAQEITDKTDGDNSSGTKKDNLVASLSASVQQLELERDQLLRQLEEQKRNHKNLSNQVQSLENKSSNNALPNGNVKNEENSALKETLLKLEERFKRTMVQIADLTDQKQQLEHLVLQLQGETETIGDYIALYQVQRGLMKKWAAEKDEYISQLSRDREELKSKLSQLQGLVINLVNKKHQEPDQNIENVIPNSRPESPERKDFSEPTFLNQMSASDLSTAKEWDRVSEASSDMIPTTVNQHHPIDHQAQKIMDLISDIGNSTLGDKPVLDTFHPCALCSGRLITV